MIDHDLIFSSAQALTASAYSTNYLDLQVAGEAIDALWFVATVPVILDSAGQAATLTIALRTAAAIAGGHLSGPTTLFTSAVIAEASLVAGYIAVCMRLPKGCLRYVELYFTVGTENFTSGAIDAYLCTTPPITV